MARLLTLLMIMTLVIANESAVAGALCRHRDARDHAIARQSQDAAVKAVALTEEAAAAAASKKGTLGGAISLSLPAYVLPASAPAPVPFAVEPLRGPETIPAPLLSRSIRPLLEPPVA